MKCGICKEEATHGYDDVEGASLCEFHAASVMVRKRKLGCEICGGVDAHTNVTRVGPDKDFGGKPILASQPCSKTEGGRFDKIPILPTDSEERKQIPIFSGVLNYFPLAIAAVARLSKRGNDKHNPGQPLHWARDKSTDHEDCIARHLIDVETLDTKSGEYEDAVALAWRALAKLQELEERRLVKPLSRGSRIGTRACPPLAVGVNDDLDELPDYDPPRRSGAV